MKQILSFGAIAVVLACLLGLAYAQSGPLDVPTLTSEQRLQLQNVSQRLQIAQLQAQAAQRDFDAARTELQALLKTLEKDGYTLDLQTLSYSKKEAAPKK